MLRGFEFAWDDGAERIELLDDFAVVPRGSIYARLGDGLSIEVEVVYDPLLERFAVEQLKLDAMPGTEVTGAAMRRIRVQDYLREAIEHMIFVRHPTGDWSQISGLRDYLEETAQIVEDREYHAASTYTLAKLANEPPLKAVSEVLGVSQSTATRLVARARARGLFHGALSFKPSSFGLREIPLERLASEGWAVNHEPSTDVLDWFESEMY